MSKKHIPDPIDEMVGLNIRLRRCHLGISQQALADEIGTTFQQIQKYEKGINRVAASRLYRLRAVLDVPYEYFFLEQGVRLTGEFRRFRFERAFLRWTLAYGRLTPALRREVFAFIENAVKV